MPTPLEEVRKLQAQMAGYGPLARVLTADEETLFAAAVEAGAVIVPRKLREYLGGKGGCPFQFEGCYVHAEDQGHDDIVQSAKRMRAKREAFYESAEKGELAPVLARINAAADQRKAA